VLLASALTEFSLLVNSCRCILILSKVALFRLRNGSSSGSLLYVPPLVQMNLISVDDR
jgi:hypothetical protein